MKRLSKIIAVFIACIMALAPVNMVAIAASASQLADEVVSVAEGEVGYTGTSTYSKYGDWYGYQGSWCTTFVLWCFNKAGKNYGVSMYGNIVPSGGNCNSMISWYQNKGRYHTRSSGYTPKTGDLVFFDWSGSGSSQHVGIVRYTSGSTVYTVEGNCSGKVKNKVYTKNGSKPYESTSSIMGYGSPDFSKVSGGSSNTTKKHTTKKHTTTTTKKHTTTTKKYTTTTKKHTTTTKKHTTTTKKHTTTKGSTTKSTTKQTTTESTTKKKKPSTTALVAKSLSIHAATTTLEIGDSVQLNYTIKPAGAPAVVGYFCDEENIIEISKKGEITAIGEGTATVVVCANDELYKQIDFVVTSVSKEVTEHQGKNDYKIIQNETSYVATTEKSAEKKLMEIGINVEQLASHRDYYILPLGLAGITAFLGLSIVGVKKLAAAIRRKKSKTDTDENQE